MQLPKFGSARLRARRRAEQELYSVLSRESSIDPITPLLASLRAQTSSVKLDNIAIGFDTNALLRVVGHRKGYEVVDYFGRARSAPTVIPGQCVQEFWNNQSKVYGSVANKIKADFGNLSKTIDKIDERFDDFADRFESLFVEFRSSFENVFDDEEQTSTYDLFSNLKDFGDIVFAPRGKFAALGHERILSRTPPGFEDGKPGDFYVWVDFLYGIRLAQLRGKKFEKAVLVSNEKKVDWTRAGFTHPLLVGEVQSLVGAPFEVWNLDRLVKEISES